MTTRALGLLFAMVLAGCQRPIDLTYQPPAQPVRDPLGIGRVIVTDERGPTADTVGAVMATDGKPQYLLTVAPDTASVVQRAFHDALAARGALAADPARARYDLAVRVIELHGLQYVTRQAEVDFVIQLIDRRNGREVYTGRVYTEQRADDYMTLRSQLLGSPTALAAVTGQTLSAAIDRALDHDGLALAAR